MINFKGNKDLARQKLQLLASEYVILHADSEKLSPTDSDPLTTILNDEFAHFSDFDTQYETTHIVFVLFSTPTRTILY